MGKYATYRKRGSHSAPPGLPQPPAPVLTIDGEGHLIGTPTGNPDPGGTMILFDSPTAVGPWTARNVRPWSNPTDLGDHADYDGPYFEAIEQGNYVVYQGNSPPSNIIGPL